MGLSLSHLLLILLIVLVLFGRGRVSSVMGEIGKGIRAMREGLKGEDERANAPKPLPRTIDQPTETVSHTTSRDANP